ncbi:hypothetical protein [Nonomuraea basaltis]|uniref:hypothetical protein n=1 Tax=Nonomuraea basaltis TaxID=2495887 RepID=UPI00110C6249|nr:hypothetical protein [Nonomuraea basaltis]TMS00129.1 hypothetical protein EJK15_03395 [Nonomuraea basaltis]
MSSTEWTEIRLIGSQRAVEGAVRILAECGAEIRSDTGTKPAQKGKDGKVRRYLVARLAAALPVQEETRDA